MPSMSDRGAMRWTPQIGLVPLACVALAGAGLGTALDLLHVRTGATTYPIGPDRLPLWVPIEFALVYVAGVLGIAAFGAPRPDARSAGGLCGEAAWLAVVYAMTALLHRYEWLVFALALAGLLARRRTMTDVLRRNLLPAVALVAGGCIVETVLTRLEVFSYDTASLGTIAVWLPLLYATAVPFGLRMTETALWFSRSTERQPA